MNTIVWLGPRSSARTLRDGISLPELEILEFLHVEAALPAIVGVPVAAAIVSADWGDATPTIRKLNHLRPEIQILVATNLGVPDAIALALQAGASNVIDLTNNDPKHIGKQLRHALEMHRKSLQERQLLLRLRSLNEHFLKNMVALEQRNIELEERLEAVAEMDTDGPFRVLLVDDDEAIQSMFKMMLQSSEYDLSVCSTAEIGLTKFRETPFPLVITDKNLPGMNGLQLVQEVKRISRATDVILVTGYGSKESVLEAYDCGITGYLEKPFDEIAKVVGLIDSLVRKHRQRRKKQHYLRLIKDRNRDFLEQYRSIREDLEDWLQGPARPASA